MTYWLRVMVGILTLSLLAFALREPFHSRELGQKLFSTVNRGLFLSIWLLVPLLTADCIAREKREGTLGLLFLTPLTAAGIVIGKSLSNGLRALTVFMAVVPMLTLPFLMGGLIWKNWAMAMLINSSAMLLALASGMLASALARHWARACVLSFGFSLLFFLLFVFLHWMVFIAS